MVEQVTLQTYSILLTGAGMIIALVYYALTIRNQDRTRQAQLMMSLYEVYRSPEFKRSWGAVIDQEYTDFEDFWGRYGGQVNRESWDNWMSVASYFHGIGILLKEGLIDIKLLDQLLVNMVFASWLKMGPILKGFREHSRSGDARFGELGNSTRHLQMSGFDYLYNELRRREDAGII